MELVIFIEDRQERLKGWSINIVEAIQFLAFMDGFIMARLSYVSTFILHLSASRMSSIKLNDPSTRGPVKIERRAFKILSRVGYLTKF